MKLPTKKSVLIVDNQTFIADDISFHLVDMGIKDIQVSLKYEGALNKVLKNNFGLALLDIYLYGSRDSIHLANFIVKLETGLPSIFIISYCDKDTIQRAEINL